MSRRRGNRGPLRFLIVAAVLIWLVPKLVAPIGVALAAVVAVPLLLVASIVAVALLAVVLAAAAGAAGLFAVPAWLVWRASRDDRERRQRDAFDRQAIDEPDREGARLRRRYLVGQLTDDQFRDAMLSHLKKRFAGGSLDVAEYEAEVSRLLHADLVSTPLRELKRPARPAGKASSYP